jgi:hypothetical protein
MRRTLVIAGVVTYFAGLGIGMYLPETRAALLAPIQLLWRPVAPRCTGRPRFCMAPTGANTKPTRTGSTRRVVPGRPRGAPM